jgi:hypothetical protein
MIGIFNRLLGWLFDFQDQEIDYLDSKAQTAHISLLNF